MITRKWTPGPWKVFTTPTHEVIGIGQSTTAEGITDCGFGVWGGGDAEATANAHMLAAAPEMYDALENLVARFENACRALGNDAEFITEATKQHHAALAKARGGTSIENDPPPANEDHRRI